MSDLTLGARGRSGGRVAGLVGVGLLAALVAAVVTTSAAALLVAAGADFEVDGGEVPVAAFGTVTAFFSVVGTVVAAALLRWSARPAQRFLAVAALLTAASLVPPVLWGRGAGTVLALVGLHLLAAAVVVPTLVRSLRARSATVRDRRV